jgi:AmpD protein
LKHGSPIPPRRRLAIDAAGFASTARRIRSPNRDARPAGVQIELIVVHGISLPPGEFGGDAIARLFTNTLDPRRHPYFASIAKLRVSAHFLIRRDWRALRSSSLRRPCLARRRFSVAWPRAMQRLLDRHRARRHR